MSQPKNFLQIGNEALDSIEQNIKTIREIINAQDATVPTNSIIRITEANNTLSLVRIALEMNQRMKNGE